MQVLSCDTVKEECHKECNLQLNVRKKICGHFHAMDIEELGEERMYFLKKNTIFSGREGGIPRTTHNVILSNKSIRSIRMQCLNAQVGEKFSNHYRNNDWVILLLKIAKV